MRIDDSKCICGNCLDDGYCPWQRTISRLQDVAFNMVPKDEIVLAIHVKACDGFKPKGQ